MKPIFALMTALMLTGCNSPYAGPNPAQPPQPGAVGVSVQTAPAPWYEYQLEYEYSDAATPFLHLVEVRDP